MLPNISKKTKIVCTIGPASQTKEMILKLYASGMNVMRVNFSHGDHEEQLGKIKIARQLENEGIYLPVCLDTKGPEIRTGYMQKGGVPVQAGQRMKILMENVVGDEKQFSVTYSGLYEDVKPGDHILIDDGELDLEVIGKDSNDRSILVEAKNDHLLKDQKGVNCPFSRLSMPFISEQDEKDLAFGVEQHVDAIFASFTRRPEDILDIKRVLAKYGDADIPVFAKIENPEGVSKIDQIIDVADGVMVARGDLGVEVPPEEVPVIQRHIIKRCRQKGKPVITATQMLDSMQKNPRPTRAEVSDVATAIEESSDCVMLSGESASGKYPVFAVEMQAKISATMEKYLNYEELAKEAYDTSEHSNNDAISNAVANTALLVGAKLIINFTESGKSTARISKARPCCPIISITNCRRTALRSGWLWGVYSVLLKTSMPDFIEEMEVLALKIARNLGIPAGSPIIIVGGTPTGVGKTNFMRIVEVNDITRFAK
ncbi:MAG: pyruvate kinase [Candidatus Enteromonas sp.]|nr:pyruvate kinase [bacterium]MDY6101100.1 pyruvate kinase [Candidatus Enteromonas sp.]